MTPRERVLTALDHRAPDRTPCDFWAEESTWNRLFAHVGHEDKDRLLDELGVDVRHLEVPDLPERAVGGGVYQNFWGERYVYHETPWGPMREDVRGTLADARTLADLERFDWPTPDQLDYSPLAEQCRRWEPYALLYGFADVWQRPALVRGWEGMFLDMVERPDWVHFLCRKFTDFYREDYTRAAAATGSASTAASTCSTCCRTDRRSRSGPRSAGTAKRSAAAAATSWAPPTCSSPTCRRKTCWPCIKPSGASHRRTRFQKRRRSEPTTA